MPKTKLKIGGLAVAFALAFAFAPVAARADEDPARGLWVGEVTLTKVNETVSGIDAANQTISPDPAVTTPVASPAHLRILLHVDGQGNVKLLKSVALLDKSTNSTQPDIALITDPTLYPNFTSVGKRIASAAYDFGDPNAVQILNLIAGSAATAAAGGSNATAAASQVMQGADVDANYKAFIKSGGFANGVLGAAAAATYGAIQSKTANSTPQQVVNGALNAATNSALFVTLRANALGLQSAAVLPDARYAAAADSVAAAAANAAANLVNGGITNAASVGSGATNAALLGITNALAAPALTSPAYHTFITSSTFLSSPGIAASAATSSLAGSTGLSQTQKQNLAQAAALKALTDSHVFAAADAVVVNETSLTGSLAAGGTLTGSLYLGANHPTNPFRHRMHPDHTIGYEITRKLQIHFDSASGTNAFQTAGFGVDKITGTYREEISGLHKPLGPNQDIGLITDGSITLNRVSLVDTLNQ